MWKYKLAEKYCTNIFTELVLHVINSHHDIRVRELDYEVLELLTVTCFKKLTDVIHKSITEQERYGERKLTTYNFQKGLLLCNEEPVSNVFVPKIKKKRQKNLFDALKNKEIRSLHTSPVPQVKEFWLGNDNPLDKDLTGLSDDLKLYFQLVTNAFESRGEPRLIALEDLKRNKNILHLVPFFVNFIQYEIISDISNFTKLSIMLSVMQSLLLNPFIPFGYSTHLRTMAYLLIKCLLSPLHRFDGSLDFQLLKDKAADLLNWILKRNKCKKLWFELLFVLEAAFCDVSKSFITCYGALTAINSMGSAAAVTAVLPHIDRYMKHLNSVSLSNYSDIVSMQAVKDQLLRSYYLMVSVKHLKCKKGYFPETYISEVDKYISPSCLTSFSDHFGDMLVPYFPPLYLVSISVDSRKKVKCWKSSSKIAACKLYYKQMKKISAQDM